MKAVLESEIATRIKSALPVRCTLALLTGIVVLLGSRSIGVAQLTNSWPPYHALYCLGFSWTDTQGLYMSGQPDFVNGNPDYWQNRASNGPMWPELLSTNLGLAYVVSNNFARGLATTADTLTQVGWLGSPSDPAHDLYVVWVAAGDFLNNATLASDPAWNLLITNLLNTSSNIIQGLYAKGARAILVQNCLDMSLAPHVITQIGSNTNQLAKLKQKTVLFNSGLRDLVSRIQNAHSDLRASVVDVFTFENQVYTNSAMYGFTKIFPGALTDGKTAFNGPGADYMFWDDLHGTRKFQQLVAQLTGEALTNSAPETLEMQLDGNGLTLRMNHLLSGRAYSLQRSLDLTTWQEATFFAAASGTNQWTESAPASPRAFYRLMWTP